MDDGRIVDLNIDLPLSRRGFLATSSIAALGAIRLPVTEGSNSIHPSTVELDDVLLRREDLIAPSPDTYTELPIGFDDGSLAQHIRTDIGEVSNVAGAATGFVARRHHRDLPLFIESAAFDTGDFRTTQAVTGATSDWIRATRGTNEHSGPINVKAGADGVQWIVRTTDEWLDAVQIQLIGSSRVLFVSVFGPNRAQIDPLSAVEYYAQRVRTRAAAR